MPKGKSPSKPLRRGTAVYIAIQTKVDELWEQHHDDIKQWPNPSKLFEEFELCLEPYGDSRSQRLQKFRTLYNKLTKEKFKLHGYDKVDLNARYKASSNPPHQQPPLNPNFFFGAAAQDIRNPANHTACDSSDESLRNSDDYDNDSDDDEEGADDDEEGADDDEVSCDDSFLSDCSSDHLSQVFDSCSLGSGLPRTPNKPKTSPAVRKESQNRITTVVEDSTVIFPILAPKFYIQGDGRKVATCTIPISSDVSDVQGFIDTDRRTIRLVFEYNSVFLEPGLIISGLEKHHPSYHTTNALVVENTHSLPIKYTQVFCSPFSCEEFFYPQGIGKDDGLFHSFVVATETIPGRAQVEFAVVEHATDSHKKRSASKNIYNHAAEVLRKQQEQVRYEEWKRSQEAATSEAQHQQSRDRVRSREHDI